MMDLLIEQYHDRGSSTSPGMRPPGTSRNSSVSAIEEHNARRSMAAVRLVETAPLPAGAQFLNVIESVFSGMARAIIHNSDYKSLDEAKAAIDRYFADRNAHFLQRPQTGRQ